MSDINENTAADPAIDEEFLEGIEDIGEDEGEDEEGETEENPIPNHHPEVQG